jgi:hypothetical protein
MVHLVTGSVNVPEKYAAAPGPAFVGARPIAHARIIHSSATVKRYVARTL